MQLKVGWRMLGAAATFAVLAAPAVAQSQAQQDAPAQAQPSGITDQKIDAAAAALEKVTDIKRSYEQQLTSAPPADQERIVSEANTALSKAVTDHGLSVDEYNSIIKVAQNDPQVRQKILSRVKTK
jgi:predicted ATPase with chaperone activity